MAFLATLRLAFLATFFLAAFLAGFFATFLAAFFLANVRPPNKRVSEHRAVIEAGAHIRPTSRNQNCYDGTHLSKLCKYKIRRRVKNFCGTRSIAPRMQRADMQSQRVRAQCERIRSMRCASLRCRSLRVAETSLPRADDATIGAVACQQSSCADAPRVALLFAAQEIGKSTLWQHPTANIARPLAFREAMSASYWRTICCGSFILRSNCSVLPILIAG